MSGWCIAEEAPAIDVDPHHRFVMPLATCCASSKLLMRNFYVISGDSARDTAAATDGTLGYGGIDIATTGPEQKALLEHQNEFPTSAGDICIAACVEGASGPGHGQSRCWQGSSSSHTSGCAALSLHDRAVQASFMKCIVSSAVSSSAIQDVPSPGNIHTPLGAAHTAVD
jgi:hypothetical protein